MRWRTYALISLGVNVLLAAVALVFLRQHLHPANRAAGLGLNSPQVKTNLVVRRQFFSWQEVESADYPTYIQNLRDIGCPDQTIRDIIIADVNTLYARKLATDPEMVTPQQQWWRSAPDEAVVDAAAERGRELDDERRGLLARLLGPNWELGDMVSLPRPSRPGILLDGPILGGLPPEVKQALQDISNRSQDRLQAYLDAARQENKAPDPAELAKLRKQTRDELTRYLTPQQLEEFVLRYSEEANDLRTDFGQLSFFEPTPDEFRGVFRAVDSLDRQLQMLSASDPNYAQNRKLLEEQREAAIKNALGPRRYQEYRALHDPLYRDAVAAAQEAGTPDAAGTIYAINLAAASEQNSILGDTNLTDIQKTIALKRLELEQLQAKTVASGQPLPPEPPAPATPPPKRTYTLQQGDSAAVVSMIYGVPIGDIRTANPGVDVNKLKPGDIINVPPIPSGCARQCGRTLKAKAGMCGMA